MVRQMGQSFANRYPAKVFDAGEFFSTSGICDRAVFAFGHTIYSASTPKSDVGSCKS